MKQARTIARDLIGGWLVSYLEDHGLRVVHADEKAARAAEALAGDTEQAAEQAAEQERAACLRCVLDAGTLWEAARAIRARGAS